MMMVVVVVVVVVDVAVVVALTFSQCRTDRLVLHFQSLPMLHQAASARSTGMFMAVH